MTTQFFNFNRFISLLNRQITLNLKTWMIAIGSIGGALIFVSFMMMLGGAQENIIHMYKTFGVVSFFITGLVFSSMSFSEMGTYSKSLQFITLPATRFEKYFTSWFISSVLFFLLSLISLVVFSMISSLLSVSIFHGTFEVLNPFTRQLGEIMLGFFVAHSAFFAGSVWFKKAAFFKTLLTGFILQTIANFWGLIWGFAILKPHQFDNFQESEFSNFVIQLDGNGAIEKYVIGFFVLIAVILLIAGWERFKEREV
ncbi:MAG: hypothetical protein CVU02_03440 [Bacteroidetes bacterium HGW-Bacteroidetes-19]|nr:MAG: hypothetical protein CVU04_03565 [Bacteroidetes bacterium HGW-Bacteroidetes-20]PKP27448.1 MAG: hypothetical protein CVU02_03440 [Bacteroidetes bacterium HGW-Bacteroidetes-19]